MKERYSDTSPVYKSRDAEEPIDTNYLNVSRMSSLFWTLAGLLDGLLTLRFILKLIGANPQSAFAAFVYGVSEPFLIPFRSLAGSPAFDSFVLELPVLIAIVVYSIAAYTLIRLFWLVFYRPEDARR